MSYSIFPVIFTMPRFREFRAFDTEESRAAGGRSVRASLVSSAGLLVARGGLRLPDANGKTFADFATFYETLLGSADSFLYLPWWNRHRKIVQEVIGTGNGALADFAVTRRYVDITTLVIRVGGVTKTVGADFTIQDLAGGAYALGDTGLQVHFGTPPASGSVDASYSCYFPMIFEDDDALDQLATVATSGSDETLATFFADEIRLRQTFPGSERVTVPVV